MADYKVIKRFIDKDTKKLVEKGSTFKCTEKRYKEIQSHGKFLVPIEAEKPKK